MDIYQTFSIWKEAVVKTIRYLLIYLFIYLFIIGVELLSLQIKSNPKIKGAWVNDTAGFTTLAKNRETSYVSMIAVFKT